MQLTPEQKKGIASFAGVPINDENLIKKVFDYYEHFVPNDTEITEGSFYKILNVMIKESLYQVGDDLAANMEESSREARALFNLFGNTPHSELSVDELSILWGEAGEGIANLDGFFYCLKTLFDKNEPDPKGILTSLIHQLSLKKLPPELAAEVYLLQAKTANSIPKINYLIKAMYALGETENPSRYFDFLIDELKNIFQNSLSGSDFFKKPEDFVKAFIVIPGLMDYLIGNIEKKKIKSSILHHLLYNYGYFPLDEKLLLVYVIEKIQQPDLKKEVKETVSSYIDQHQKQFSLKNKQDEVLDYLADIYQSEAVDLEILRKKEKSAVSSTDKKAAILGLICRSNNVAELKRLIKENFAFLEKCSVYIEKTTKPEQKALLHFLFMRHCAELPGEEKGRLALNFAYSANEAIKDENITKQIYKKVIKNYPWTASSYIKLIRYMEESDNGEEKKACQKMIQGFPIAELVISKQDEIIRKLQEFSESDKISEDFFISFAETIYKNFNKNELGGLLKENFSRRPNPLVVSPIHRRAMFRAMLSKVDSPDEILVIYNNLFPAYLPRTAIISDLNYFAFSGVEPCASYVNIILAKFLVDQKKYESALTHLLKIKSKKGITLLAGNSEFHDFMINKIAPVRDISTARKNRKRSKEESSSLQLSKLPEDGGKVTLAELMFLVPASKEQLSKIPLATILKVFEITNDKLFVAKQLVKNGLLTLVANQDVNMADVIFSMLTLEEERKEAVSMLLASPYYVALNSKKSDKFENFINILGIEKSFGFYEIAPLAGALVNKFYDKLTDSQRLLLKDFLSPAQLQKLGVKDDLITKELLSQLDFDQAYEIFKESNGELQRKAAKQILNTDLFIEKATDDQIIELCKSCVIAAGEAKFVLDRISALKGNGRNKLILGFVKSKAINKHAMGNDVFESATPFDKNKFYRGWFTNLALSGSDLSEIIKSSKDPNILAAVKSDDGLMAIILQYFVKMNIKEIAQNDLIFNFIIEYFECKNADFFITQGNVFDKLIEVKPLAEIKVSSSALKSKLVCAATKYKEDDKEARVALCLQNLDDLNGAVTDVLNSYKSLIQSPEPADQKLVFPLVAAIFSSPSLQLGKINKDLLLCIVDGCITKPQDTNSIQILDRIIAYAYGKDADAALIGEINKRIDVNWREHYAKPMANNLTLSSSASQNFSTAVQIGAILQSPESVVEIGYEKFCEFLILYEKISKLLKFNQYQDLLSKKQTEKAEKVKKYQVSGAIYKGILLNLQKDIEESQNEAASGILNKYKKEKLIKDDDSTLSNLFYEWFVGSEQGDIEIHDSIINNILSSLLSKESAFKADLKIPIDFPAEDSKIFDVNGNEVGKFKKGCFVPSKEIAIGAELYSDNKRNNYLGTYISKSDQTNPKNLVHEIDPEILVSAKSAQSLLLDADAFSKMTSSRKESLFKRICQQSALSEFLKATNENKNKKVVIDAFIDYLSKNPLSKITDWDAVVGYLDKDNIIKVFEGYFSALLFRRNLSAASALVFALLRHEEKFTAFGVETIFDMFMKAEVEIQYAKEMLDSGSIKCQGAKNCLLLFLLSKEEYINSLLGVSKEVPYGQIPLQNLKALKDVVNSLDLSIDIPIKLLEKLEKLDIRVKLAILSNILNSSDFKKIESLLTIPKVFPIEMILGYVFEDNDRILNALQVGHPLCYKILSNLEYHDHVRAAVTYAAQNNIFNIFYLPVQRQLRTDVLAGYIPQFINEWLKSHKERSKEFNQFTDDWENSRPSEAVKSLLSFAKTADAAGKMMVADQLFKNPKCIKHIKEVQKKYKAFQKLVNAKNKIKKDHDKEKNSKRKAHLADLLKHAENRISKLNFPEKNGDMKPIGMKKEDVIELTKSVHSLMDFVGKNISPDEMKVWFKALGHKVEEQYSTVNKTQLKAVHNLSKIFKFHHGVLTAEQKTISKDAKREADLQLNEISPKGSLFMVTWNKFLNLLRSWTGRDYVADQVDISTSTSKIVDKPTPAQPSINAVYSGGNRFFPQSKSIPIPGKNAHSGVSAPTSRGNGSSVGLNAMANSAPK